MTELLLGDVVEWLRELGDESFDGVLTDTPYGIGIFDMRWDRAFTHGESPPSLQEEVSYAPAASLAYQRWCREWCRELIRVVKPGGFLFAFGSPRTYHRLVRGLEDAGWQIRDTISWIYGQEFPRQHDISKAIDSRLIHEFGDNDIGHDCH